MWKNKKGEQTPSCGDCVYGDDDKECPDDAMMDTVYEDRGVLDCPPFMPRNSEIKALLSRRGA